MFLGRHRHTIDAKGRLSVPARFREALAEYQGDELVVVPEIHDRCLEVHPMEEWRKLSAKLQDQPRFSADVRDAGRLYFSRAHEIALDGVGRILLPPDLREQVGLGKDVVLVGLSLSYFEIWDRGRFEEFDRDNRPRRQEIQDGLANKGV
jgi:MraZ protein